MRAISLFSGIGGLDLGFERAGIQTVLQAERDPFCLKVLEKHWPDVERVDDVRKVGAWVKDKWEIDLIYGGDPCQANSNAARHGTLQEPLGGEFIRVIDEIRPKLVLRENPGVVRKAAPWPWYRFKQSLEDLGYLVLPFRLRACCVGADHRRERMFLLAELQDSNSPRLEGYVSEILEQAQALTSNCDIGRPSRWSATSRISRGVDGLPNRMDRIRSLGNAVVPQVAEQIGRIINASSYDVRKD